MLKNELFLVSSYLDPRYKVFISEIDQTVATNLGLLKVVATRGSKQFIWYTVEPNSFKISSANNDLDILIKARKKTAQQHLQSFTLVISTSNNAMQRNSIMVLLNCSAKTPDWEKTKMFCDTENNLKIISGSYINFLK